MSVDHQRRLKPNGIHVNYNAPALSVSGVSSFSKTFDPLAGVATVENNYASHMADNDLDVLCVVDETG